MTIEVLFDGLRKNTCFHSFLVNYFFNNNLVWLTIKNLHNVRSDFIYIFCVLDVWGLCVGGVNDSPAHLIIVITREWRINRCVIGDRCSGAINNLVIGCQKGSE